MAELKDLIKRELESRDERTSKRNVTLKDEINFRELDMLEESPNTQPNFDKITTEKIFNRFALDPNEVYEESLHHMRGIIAKIKDGGYFKIDKLFTIAEKIIDSLQSYEPALHKYLNGQKENSLLIKFYSIEQSLDDMAVHCVNVAVLAIDIGIGLKYEKERLIQVGVAAFLHDIGMCKIPSSIIYKPGLLSQKEYDIVKRHPEYGLEILTNLGEEHAWLKKTILQEHERSNGTGYLKGIKGEDIHEYAKIIGIADVYEALSHSRPYRGYLLPHHAMKEIMKETKEGVFSSHILKALIERLSIFPLYSIVKLNSGAIGRVIETNKSYPLSPTIETLVDPQGKKMKERDIIKLANEPLLHISEAIDKRDIPE
ncbi:MAG: HD domain-containing protein [Thermodesulfobacteriota bacterium]|nr:HD domain-containing protein [Thermodesulfobacteriota bacterium]